MSPDVQREAPLVYYIPALRIRDNGWRNGMAPRFLEPTPVHHATAAVACSSAAPLPSLAVPVAIFTSDHLHHSGANGGGRSFTGLWRSPSWLVSGHTAGGPLTGARAGFHRRIASQCRSADWRRTFDSAGRQGTLCQPEVLGSSADSSCRDPPVTPYK